MALPVSVMMYVFRISSSFSIHFVFALSFHLFYISTESLNDRFGLMLQKLLMMMISKFIISRKKLEDLEG